MTHTGCLEATSDNEIGKIGQGSEGLRRKLRHSSFLPLTVDPPQPSGSASSDLIFARNAIRPGSMNRPYNQ